MKQIFILFLGLIIAAPLSSQTFDKVKMDALFDKLVENDKAMGSVSIYKGDKEIYQRSFGFADVKNKLEATADTKYRIGSISKTFTAAITFSLIENGKLSLEDKLSKFYPSLPNADKITIKQLLGHRSGLFNVTNKEDYTEWNKEELSRAEMMEKIKENGSVFEPGAKGEYSNTNYVLLGYIAEDLHKKSFADILQKVICKPVNLKNTFYGSAISIENNEAHSYKFNTEWMKESETDMSIPGGAGAVVSTPSDICRFLNALFAGKIISKESVEMMKAIEEGYGLGLFQFPFDDKKAFGHNGGIDGFESSAASFLEEGMTFAGTLNGSNMNTNNMLLGLLSIYFGEEYELPEFKEAVFIEEADLAKYAGTYETATMPMDIEMFVQDGQLFGQATGQGAFPLEAYETDKFRFEPAGILLDFIPEENKFILNQGGGKFEFTKKKE